jgi:integrator complex subunit 1
MILMTKGTNILCCFQAREPRREAYTWSESQDQILVTWSTGEESTMHILVVHAMIILLNYGPGQGMHYKKF